ncbi:MAG: hypothetical protein SD837_21910 [Candidatus Electrothrix scaldis]|nr:MAG: hypothetical protein SD837_21910 [Candidatus Electrothrix sp. GW3-3]
MSHPLEKTLGRCFSAQDVADYLQCDVTTVYRNYVQLGGVRLGKVYKFFEQGVVNAILQQTAQEVARPDKARREEVPPFVRYETAGKSLGDSKVRISRKAKQTTGADPHNIFG